VQDGPPARQCYGVTFEIRVAQFPSGARVPPQVPNELPAVRYSASVHVWAMYSEEIQIEFPSGAAAP